MNQHRQVSASLNNSVQQLGYKNYDDYLGSDHWRRFRELYQCSAMPQACLCCGDSRYCLHHITYRRLGKEQIEDVIPLCHDCHDKVHAAHRNCKIPLNDYAAAVQVVKTGTVQGRPSDPLTKKQKKAERRKQNKKRRQKFGKLFGKVLIQCVCGRRAVQDGPFCCLCGRKSAVLRVYK